MARPAPQIRFFQLLFIATVLLGLPFTARGQSPVPPTLNGSTSIQVPVQEQLPLGGIPEATSGGETTPAGGYLPDLMEFVRVGGALVGVIGLLLCLRLVLRRLGGMPSARRPSGVVQVHGRYPVARGQQVVLLQIGQRIIVAHQGSAGMRTLAEITEPDEVASLKAALDGGSGRPSNRDFQQTLAQVAAASDDRVVDLTRPVRNRDGRGESAPRRTRLPGWRGVS